jgi:antitoxin (DNA-binding transcriptional repressor) of toxin-antitoxin stability system
MTADPDAIIRLRARLREMSGDMIDPPAREGSVEPGHPPLIAASTRPLTQFATMRPRHRRSSGLQLATTVRVIAIRPDARDISAEASALGVNLIVAAARS